MIANTARSGPAIGLLGSPALVVGNVMVANTADVLGGALVANDFSDALIQDNWIVGNSSGWYGGGVGCTSASPVLIRNLIAHNSTRVGGGIYLLSFASPQIVKTTVVANQADSIAGGVYAWGFCSPTITNTIVWANEGDEIFAEFESYPEVTYCDVEGGWPGEGNVDADPSFVLAERRDFRLLWDSPCVDTGDPDSLDPDGTRADIGAFFFDQDDYLTLYLTPDTTVVTAGSELGVTYTVINRWAAPEPVWALAQAVVPGGTVLGLLGPVERLVPGNTAVQQHVVHEVPLSAPIGTYRYRAGIGLPPSTLYDVESFGVEVVEPSPRGGRHAGRSGR